MAQSRKIKLHPISLAFLNHPDLEPQFQQHHFQNSLTQVRITLLLGCLFYFAVLLLDPNLLPITSTLTCLLKLLFFPLIIFSVYGLSYSRAFTRLGQPLEALFLLATAGLLIMEAASGPAPVRQYYHTGLLLVFMAGYSIIQLRLIWAAGCGLIITTIYLTSIIQIGNLTGLELITRSFLVLAANIIGLISCYCIESLQRRSFAWQHLLTKKQDQFQGANIDLEKKIRERTEQLLKANRQLTRQIALHSQQKRGEQTVNERLEASQHLEAIASLAGGIAHDFNNILAAILGFSDLGLIKSKDHELRDHLSAIRTATLRGRDLVSQITAFRPQSEHKRYPLEIRHLVKEAMKFLRASLPPAIELQLQLDQALSKVMADPISIHQAFMNICTNGVEAMETADGCLQISLIEEDLAPESVKPELPAGRYQHLTITDNGRGMDDNEIKHILEPYFTSKKKGHGSGMGLSITQEIMDRHQGGIRVESDKGKGSSFHLFFPVLVEEKSNDKATDPLAMLAKAPNQERIMLVDDEEALVKMGVKMLTFLGYRATGCTEATKALELIIDEPGDFDLVITDMAMPVMSGSELAGRIMECCPEMPIILLTGYVKDWDETKAMDHGFKAFLAKPLGLQKMADTIRSVLEQWQRTGP